MNIRDEELVQRYFERSMSSSEEQNFLIDVAARDDMRMAFRSQLELLKTIKFDKDVIGGAGLVRERTLAALGLSATVVTATDEATAAPSFMQNVRGFLTKPYTMLLAGVVAGGLATYSFMPSSAPTDAIPEKQIHQVVQPSPEQSQIQGAPTPELPTNVSPIQTKRVVDVKPEAAPAVEGVQNDSRPSEVQPIVNTDGVSPVIKNKVNIRKPGEAK